jgi:hypothetical protein
VDRIAEKGIYRVGSFRNFKTFSGHFEPFRSGQASQPATKSKSDKLRFLIVKKQQAGIITRRPSSSYFVSFHLDALEPRRESLSACLVTFSSLDSFLQPEKKVNEKRYEKRGNKKVARKHFFFLSFGIICRCPVILQITRASRSRDLRCLTATTHTTTAGAMSLLMWLLFGSCTSSSDGSELFADGDGVGMWYRMEEKVFLRRDDDDKFFFDSPFMGLVIALMFVARSHTKAERRGEEKSLLFRSRI